MKKLGRIPAGGGWRMLGREVVERDRRNGPGYDYLHVAIDDHSRLAYVEVLSDERATRVERTPAAPGGGPSTAFSACGP